MSDERFKPEEEPAEGEPRRPYRKPAPNPGGRPTPEEVEEHLREYRKRMGIPEPKVTEQKEEKKA